MERSEGATRTTPQTTPLRLVGVERGALDIAVLTFETLGKATLPEPVAGSHVDLHLPEGIVRQYSLLTPLCTPTRHVVGVKREPDGRGGSVWLHDVLKIGDVLEASTPRNHFPLDPYAVETVLLAGGIGITPIYAMYERLRGLGRSVRLHYWCQSARHALFYERLSAAPGVCLHFSGDKMGGRWKSLSSVIEQMGACDDVYCCGPQTMLDEVTSLLQARPDVSLHLEHFHPAAVTATDARDNGFEVFLARSGKVFDIPQGRTILEVLKDASVDVAYSCEEGVCGACETKLIEGVPIHRDVVYSAADHQRRGTIMICCAGSRSKRLVLDL
jgi:tetrachlorobenzoquinone reductase